jgi:acetylornithine deacetylase/succinyl-diaminopimelate desuccinylase-like protein
MRRVISSAILMLIALPVSPRAQSPPSPDADPHIQQLVASVSEQRLRELDTTLASFGTRETMSTTASPTRGIGAARQWIFDELKRSSARLQVSFDIYQVAPQGRITRSVELRNVIALLPGRTARRIYISGHYDSVNLGSQQNLVDARCRQPTRAPRLQP